MPKSVKCSVQFISFQSLSRVWLFVTHELQHARPPCPSPTPRAYSNSCPSRLWCHPTISSSVTPFPSTFSHSQHQCLFQVAKVLESQLQHQSLKWTPRNDFLQDWLVWSPCSSRDSQESSPTPQFKSINSYKSTNIIHEGSILMM